MSTENATTPNPPTFPEESQFDETNFASFQDSVLIAACTRGTRGYLDGTVKNSVTMVTQKTKEDTETSYRVKTTNTGEDNKTPVVESTMNPVDLGIRMGRTAAKAWEALTSTYGTISDLVAMGAENHLHTTMYTDGADFL
ncbi:hypothetical protein C0993_001072 [Termitomyces sp. T159_Od127]|nr:hypothetical protein C0993_001072 [Termitomyces sp. T159_Od127]